MSATASSSRFSDFPPAFKGPLYRPGDADYDDVKQLWNSRRSDRTPALIARATDVDDVVTAVDYARSQDIGIAVRGGGHGIEGNAMPDDALVIDVSQLKRITVDPETRKIVAETGALLGEVYAAAEQHGLVVPAGTVSTVSVGGLTLGGGFGHLTRTFGTSIDNLLSVDVVTVDGRRITASADENADLFWGLKGAGQNLAVATSFTFQGQRLESVFSRDVIFAPEDAATALAAVDAALERAPRELGIIPLVRQADPAFGLPEEMSGQPIVMLSVVYTGDPEKYEDAWATALEEFPTPIYDGEGPTTWVEVNAMIDQWMPAGRRWYNGGGYVEKIPKELAEITLDCVAAGPADCEIHFPGMSGAFHDFDEESAVLARGVANWTFEITAQWDDPSDDDEYVAWVEEAQARLAPYTLSYGATNLTPVPYRGLELLKELYGSPERWERLLALKQTWDPDNRLRYNKNITAG